MRDWYELYCEQINKKGGIDKYFNYKICHKKKLLKIIKKYANNGKIIEAGCGTGIITTELAKDGFDITGIDINIEILKLACEIETKVYGNNNAKFEQKSIFELNYPKNYFDVCFSCGVLEHFDDKKIKESIRQQLEIAKFVIIAIPTKWFNDYEALKGDDRFLPLTYWRALINSAGGNIIEEQSYHHFRTIAQRVKALRRIFRPMPYRIFVVKNARMTCIK